MSSEQSAGAEEYGAGAIQVLEGLEAVRKRPGMYIGSTGPRGLHHLVYEIVDNSVDEALAGYCDAIDVTILEDGGVRVVDNGRGIPVDPHPTEGRSTVEVVLTVLHAGGKFGGGGYAVSGGLHGVGSSVVNALSSRFEVEVKRQGFTWNMSFTDSVPDAPLAQGEPSDETGTTITFWPSPEIFETVEFDYATLRTRFQQYAFLNKGLKVTLTDLRPQDMVEDEEGELVSPAAPHDEFLYERGLEDYVQYLNSAKRVEVVNEEIISFEAEDTERKIAVEVAMQWTTAYTESVHTYANTINTHEGGTHEEGFRAALTTLVNRYAREKSILRAAVADLLPRSILERSKSAYPSTQDPRYERLLRAQVAEIMADHAHPVHPLLHRPAIEALLAQPLGNTSMLGARVDLERVRSVATWIKDYRVALNI